MREVLFQQVYDKVVAIINKKSINSVAVYLDVALKEKNIKVIGSSDRNLTRYLDKYISGKKDDINPNIELLNAISKYMGYSNYEEFVSKHQESENTGSKLTLEKIKAKGDTNADITQEGGSKAKIKDIESSDGSIKISVNQK